MSSSDGGSPPGESGMYPYTPILMTTKIYILLQQRNGVLNFQPRWLTCVNITRRPISHLKLKIKLKKYFVTPVAIIRRLFSVYLAGNSLLCMTMFRIIFNNPANSAREECVMLNSTHEIACTGH